jgi:hypothetical protein
VEGAPLLYPSTTPGAGCPISAWFWQMWDSAGPPLKSVAGRQPRPSVARISYYAALDTTACAAFSQRKPHEVAQRHHFRQEIRDRWDENDGRPQISYFALLARATGAALLGESRMKSINATGLHRKSGGSPTRAFRSGPCALFLRRPFSFEMRLKIEGNYPYAPTLGEKLHQPPQHDQQAIGEADQKVDVDAGPE